MGMSIVDKEYTFVGKGMLTNTYEQLIFEHDYAHTVYETLRLVVRNTKKTESNFISIHERPGIWGKGWDGGCCLSRSYKRRQCGIKIFKRRKKVHCLCQGLLRFVVLYAGHLDS